MSWASELFSGSDPQQIVPPTPEQAANYYRQVKANNPGYYETIKASDPEWIAAQGAALSAAPGVVAASAPAPSAAPSGPEVALQRLNDTLGSGFENRLLPDTLDSPFVNAAYTTQRGKADDFIANMLKRGTLTESGRAGAIGALDTQAGGIRSKLNDLGSALLTADRGRLTNLANAKRAEAQQTPTGADYDPSGALNAINAAGVDYAGSFGNRFNASLPTGDLFDTSGIGAASGGVTSPQNVAFDPYAQEGGKLTTGLGDNVAPAASDKKRRTSVF